jgi:hypothetical protein
VHNNILKVYRNKACVVVTILKRTAKQGPTSVRKNWAVSSKFVLGWIVGFGCYVGLISVVGRARRSTVPASLWSGPVMQVSYLVWKEKEWKEKNSIDVVAAPCCKWQVVRAVSSVARCKASLLVLKSTTDRHVAHREMRRVNGWRWRRP